MQFVLNALSFRHGLPQQREHLHELQATFLGNQRMQRMLRRRGRRPNVRFELRHHLVAQEVGRKQFLRKLKVCEIAAQDMQQRPPGPQQRSPSSSRFLRLLRGLEREAQRQPLKLQSRWRERRRRGSDLSRPPGQWRQWKS